MLAACEAAPLFGLPRGPTAQMRRWTRVTHAPQRRGPTMGRLLRAPQAPPTKPKLAGPGCPRRGQEAPAARSSHCVCGWTAPSCCSSEATVFWLLISRALQGPTAHFKSMTQFWNRASATEDMAQSCFGLCKPQTFCLGLT